MLDVESSYHRDKDLQGVGAALQNMLLAAYALELGAVWLGEILKNGEQVIELLNLPARYELMAVLALGFPADTKPPSRGREKAPFRAAPALQLISGRRFYFLNSDRRPAHRPQHVGVARMYDQAPPSPANDEALPPIMASQATAGLSLSRRRSYDRRRATPYSSPTPQRSGKKAEYREILEILKRTCAELKLDEQNLHITLLELPEGFLLKAYDCHSNRQVCREIRERFFHSPEKIERLVREIMSGTGILLDIDG